jgi:hypothetical protein
MVRELAASSWCTTIFAGILEATMRSRDFDGGVDLFKQQP